MDEHPLFRMRKALDGQELTVKAKPIEIFNTYGSIKNLSENLNKSLKHRTTSEPKIAQTNQSYSFFAQIIKESPKFETRKSESNSKNLNDSVESHNELFVPFPLSFNSSPISRTEIFQTDQKITNESLNSAISTSYKNLNESDLDNFDVILFIFLILVLLDSNLLLNKKLGQIFV